MSSGKILANQYIKTTGKDIPTDSSKYANWLLTTEYGCYVDGDIEFKNTEYCKENNSGRIDPTTLDPLPIINAVQEEGFLSFVSEVGPKCVNKVTGVIFDLDQTSGTIKEPSFTQSYPNAECVTECYNVTSTSTRCFDCVQKVLIDDPTICSSIPDVEEASTIMKHAFVCTECLIDKTDSEIIKECINGSGKTKFNSKGESIGFTGVEIVGITLGAAAGFFILVTLIFIIVKFQMRKNERMKVARLESFELAPLKLYT